MDKWLVFFGLTVTLDVFKFDFMNGELDFTEGLTVTLDVFKCSKKRKNIKYSWD